MPPRTHSVETIVAEILQFVDDHAGLAYRLLEHLGIRECHRGLWRVGVSTRPEERLLYDHRVSEDNERIIILLANSVASALAAEIALDKAGCDIGTGSRHKLTSDPIYVYAFFKPDIEG